ncbi:MAG: HlyD family efflux transporter periplasmic adaptor subunit [Gammaproteobacteria bacterium]|nr:HlyD family efflux transporter periplasmic adaptor subunit [Gammaproteobacteria bacterium]MDE2250266.1 HlyD family efflux transporter periplasmic adaptor subunit [Gammaproteobacteria bacterium]
MARIALHTRCVWVAALLLAACERDQNPAAVGTLERHRFEIAATAAEQIVAMPVREGQAVQQGELVARLDGGSLAATRASVAAQASQLRHRLDELRNGARPGEIDAARAQVAAATAQRDQSAKEYRRLAELAARGLVAQSQADQQLELRDSTEAALRAAQAGLGLLLQGTRPEQVDQARAALQSAESLVKQQDVLLDRLRLLAPVDGRIEALPYRLGERPQLGAPVVIMLASGMPFARVYIPEPQRAALHAGQAMQVRVDGIARLFKGTLRYIAGEASFTPYFALTQRDRSRLAFLAEVDLPEAAARDLPAGVPVEVPLGQAP